MNPRDQARPYLAFEGKVTFWMLPHNSITVSIVADRLSKAKPTGWTYQDTMFTYAEGLTVDIEFHTTDLDVDLSSLKAYWDARNEDMLSRHAYFTKWLSAVAYVQWVNAYTATREKLPEASPDLTPPPKDADPEQSAATRKPFKSKERAGGKSQKNDESLRPHP